MSSIIVKFGRIVIVLHSQSHSLVEAMHCVGFNIAQKDFLFLNDNPTFSWQYLRMDRRPTLLCFLLK